MQRVVDAFPHMIWLNPDSERNWQYSQSNKLMQQIIGPSRMFPLTLEGIDHGMRSLGR